MAGRRRSEHGQALLELALFGSLVIMLMGLVIQYAMDADATQSTMMESFRKALGIAGTSGSASVMVIRDKVTPSPANPFTVGDIKPVSSGASVTRDFRLHETADTVDELPTLSVYINTPSATLTPTRAFKTAGFDGGVPGAELDPCEGELLDQETCTQRCKDKEAARQSIIQANAALPPEPSGAGGEEVFVLQPTPVPSLPWYCDKLDTMFSGIRQMGVQPGYIKQTMIDGALTKAETDATIATTNTTAWNDQTRRSVIYRPLGNETGTLTTEPIDSTPKDQEGTKTWTTPWE